jgi:exosortase/archaeosortase family protein
MTDTRAPAFFRFVSLVLILGIGVCLALMYAPLLGWLARASLAITQLSTGALLVIVAAIVCLQDSVRELRFEPRVNGSGLALLALGFMSLWLARHLPVAVLPVAMFSFCCSFAAVVAFIFGGAGVRQFLPALGGFFVFGVLVGLFPALDWPLRALAARHAGSVLAWLGAPVQIAVEPGRPAELVLDVAGRLYRVATECNGFGLLTSSLLLATILAFQERLAWVKKLGLFALAAPMALVCNFLRIVSICLVAPRVSWSYQFVHEALGTIFYMTGLALVWLAARRARPTP